MLKSSASNITFVCRPLPTMSGSKIGGQNVTGQDLPGLLQRKCVRTVDIVLTPNSWTGQGSL